MIAMEVENVDQILKAGSEGRERRDLRITLRFLA